MTKILVVEDSPTQSEQLRLVLEATGFTVETSPDGEQALKRLAGSAFDLVISDIMMPGISGYELCHRIKSDPATREVPVVLLTTLSDPLDIVQGLECGADNFVTKPYDPGYLVGRLNSILENRRLRADGRLEAGVEVLFLGRKFTITSGKEQILDLLTSTFEDIVRTNRELQASEDALRAAKAEAEEAREEAERGSRAKSEFLSRMSHELRTPLNAILGFAQLLQIDLGPEHGESVEHILRAGRHLLQLIEELLDVARIEQDRLSLSIEPVHLDEVVREVLDLVRPSATPADIHFRAETSPLARHVLADRQRLKQVLMNLLSNAVKYNRQGGTVTVSCEPTPEGRLRIGVADTGPGISPEATDRLFLPFERLGAERSAVEGTGIGLSISKRLVELMGGEIGAESEVGRGSTFWVTLDPAEAPEEQLEAAAEEASKPPGPAGGERIVLYVEDNLSNLRLVERILARRPAVRLVAAMQGGLALELARQHLPDLILLDVHLPDIEGDEVLRRLQADPATSPIPVVTVSAEATPHKIERFLAAGARAYLTKPLDVNRFLEIVDEILGESLR